MIREMNFFDKYPAFLKTSKTSSYPNRLNRRVEALIENNLPIIKNKRILDIASHDGRFSFAAIKFGAKHVLGIEGKPYLVENSIKNMERYGIPQEKYKFVSGDIHEEIKKLEPNQIDTVFCFGFFYHTIQHMFLLSEIKRLNAFHLIIDSNVLENEKPLIEIHVQGHGWDVDEGGAIPSKKTKDNKTLVGLPSKSTIEMMLKNMNFSYKFYDWKSKKLNDWQYLGDYRRGARITINAKNLDTN